MLPFVQTLLATTLRWSLGVGISQSLGLAASGSLSELVAVASMLAAIEMLFLVSKVTSL